MNWMVVILVVIWDIDGRIVCGGSGRVRKYGWILFKIYCVWGVREVVKEFL